MAAQTVGTARDGTEEPLTAMNTNANRQVCLASSAGAAGVEDGVFLHWW
jgi:hypothetical protein